MSLLPTALVATPSEPAVPVETGRHPRIDFKQTLSARHAFALGAFGSVGFLLAWQAAASWYGRPALWPPPTAVGLALWRLFAEQSFAHDVWASCVRIALSFTLATLLALPLGLAMGAFAPLRALCGPLVAACRYLPATAFVPLFLMWLGAGEEQKIALLTVGVLFFLITLIVDDTLAVRTELIDTARTLGASRRQILLTVVLPASLPAYVDEIMAGIVVIGVLGVLADGAFRAVHRLAFPYLHLGR